MKLLTFIFLVFFLSCSAQPKPTKISTIDPNIAVATGEGLVKASSTAIYFSFTTTSTAPRTSAGVYDGEKLIRTLWSNVTFTAGKHDGYWDGKNDLQQFVANGKYQVKVLKSGIEWDWRGTFFNSSDSTTGATKWHGNPLIGIQFMGNKAFALPYYLEGNFQLFTFEANHPNQKQTHGGLIHQSTFRSCTDGKYVYALSSSDYDTYFVYAFDNNGNEVNFANGSKYDSHNSVIASFKTNRDSLIAGVAVQKHSNYLFTSTPKLNRISVFNKTTGKFIRNNKVTDAGLMVCDGNNKLWVIANDVPTQFLVNTDGSLTATGITLKGISNIQQLDISPDNSTISLIDGDWDVQQIKSYDNNTGAPTWILGQLGGYRKTAIVANDRFCFTAMPKDAAELSFINYATDGSFWVGDKGNFRYLHFDRNRKYINQFAFLPMIYNTYVDVNSPTHIYAEYIRATVDYNLPNPQKSWVLDRNYTGKIPYTIEENGNFYNVLTLKNGKTYAGMRDNNARGKDPYHIQIFELTDFGVRNTGAKYDWQAQLSNEGDIFHRTTGGPRTPVNYTKIPLTGFDVHNNPVYGFGTIYATIPIYKDSLPMGGNYTARLNNGDLVLFNPSTNDGFHLGILPRNASTFRALFSPSTGTVSQAEYPLDGYFGNGNGTNNPGGQQNAIDSFIIWNHHGEFWNRSGQTSMWQMLDKNGLNIGVWGTVQDINHRLGECVAWNSGNAIHNQIVKIGTDYFVCWDDESRHGGVHVAKIKYMNTLAYEVVNVSKTTNPTLFFSYKDLMDGLPYQKYIGETSGNWTMSDKTDGDWNAMTGFTTYQPNRKNDIRAFFSLPSGKNRTLTCNLGKNNLESWKLTGSLNFLDGIANGQFTPVALCYVNILDANNKILAQVAVNNTTPNHEYGGPHALQLNNKTVYNDPGEPWNTFRKPIYFELSSNGRTLSMNCMGNIVTTDILEKAGNIRMPKSLQIQFYGGPYARVIDLQELKFWNSAK